VGEPLEILGMRRSNAVFSVGSQGFPLLVVKRLSLV
jgi:hypothetical protein